jgi:hypothetical protein
MQRTEVAAQHVECGNPAVQMLTDRALVETLAVRGA